MPPYYRYGAFNITNIKARKLQNKARVDIDRLMVFQLSISFKSMALYFNSRQIAHF